VSTLTFNDAPETVAGFDCDGNEGVESHVLDGVFHVTQFDDGDGQRR
jgi:hypothetical protein